MAKEQADRCPFDGTRLETSGPDRGFCERGGGYPVSLNCAFACPLCGQSLGWAGGCHHCHGTRTGQREDWTFPGDGYYTHTETGAPIGDGLHYVKQQGPRVAASMAENVRGAKAIGRIMAQRLITGVSNAALRKVKALMEKTTDAMRAPDDGK